MTVATACQILGAILVVAGFAIALGLAAALFAAGAALVIFGVSLEL